ncbi:MAG: 4Fe-4S dicluster domain-containing protein, partial [Gemmatimonadales bacterium]|nr:4Fe-4S dicluster domain-containing protein [Gemmatimonadales bacterium]
GVVVLTKADSRPVTTHPCIRCGHCVDACPVYLNPQLLGNLAQVERYEEMEQERLADCMLCGCCSFTCPSNIPLSQMFQAAKVALKKQKAVA